MDASIHRGLLKYQPGCEQEVVFLFGLLIDQLPWPLQIDEVRTAYPDCLAIRRDTGQLFRIEFELYSSHFVLHRHDPTGCDCVICWEDDYGRLPNGIQTVPLKPIVQRVLPELIETPRPKREPQAWGAELFHQAALPAVSALVLRLEDLLQRDKHLTIKYNGRGKEATVNVCTMDLPGLRMASEKVLWIWGDGRYQWCWEGFRERCPQVVELFQNLVASKNVSSQGYRGVTTKNAEELLTILRQVVTAATEQSS